MGRLFDIFYCERLQSHLQKTECHRRRQENERLLDIFNTPEAIAHHICLDCSQGVEIARQVNRAGVGKKRPCYRTHGAAKAVHPAPTFELFTEEANNALERL